MTQIIGTALPPDLIARFSPANLRRHASNGVVIVTIGEDGFPHPAMLSHFEIVARDEHNLRLATYTDSRTTGNMRRTGKLTMVVVDQGAVYYLKGTVQEIRAQMKTAAHNALLNYHIDSVLADRANVEREGTTTITSGIEYEDPNLNAKLERSGEIFAEMLA